MPVVNVGGKDATLPSVIIVGGQVRGVHVLRVLVLRSVGTHLSGRSMRERHSNFSPSMVHLHFVEVLGELRGGLRFTFVVWKPR